MAPADDTAALPTGTVAFLMTDIEGSTQLVGRLADSWPAALNEHFAIIRAAVGANRGTWVSSEGDAVFAVCPSARQAIAAAIAAQREMAGHAWPGGVGLKMRVGIHAGEAVLGGRDYTGIDVHRTARMAAAGNGGQVLVSEAARLLAGDRPGEGIGYLDLGRYQLRDLPAAEHLYQVLAPGLEVAFPALRTKEAVTPTNLPTPLTRFVGRIREITEIGALLQSQRLVTLTGPGGTGKTRLAVEAARTLLSDYGDGVWFVALEVVREAALVTPTIATTLAVSEQPDRSISAVLAERLAGTRSLLVLDNFEQVVAAAPDISTLLGAIPSLTVLVSSREPLAIAGEWVYPVPPLSVPEEPGTPTADQLRGLDAVDLFVERATSVRPGFELTDSNAPVVAAICRRLDGLPLALELAAARANLFSAEQILARLDHRLTLLASSRRDLPERQRTLRGAIDWSHELLTEPERELFRRFSVFSGGADFEALAAVIDPAGELGADVLDLAGALVDRSLLRSTALGDQNRLAMLETIREYAAERLAGSAEERLLRNRHVAHFRRLAEAARDVPTDPRRNETLDRLELELPNFRAAVGWSLEGGDHASGFAIVMGLNAFWTIRSHLTEGRALLGALLAASRSEGVTTLRSEATGVASELSFQHGDFAAAIAQARDAMRMAGELDDPRLILRAHMRIGWATVATQPGAARDSFARAVDLARRANDGDVLRGSLNGLGLALLNLGDLDRALAATTEAFDLDERSGDSYSAAYAQLGIAQVLLGRGDAKAAMDELVGALRRFRDARADVGIAMAVDFVALIAIRGEQAERAARLAAFADQLRREAGGGVSSTVTNQGPPLVQARRLIGPTEYERAVAEGHAMDVDAAEAEALALMRTLS